MTKISFQGVLEAYRNIRVGAIVQNERYLLKQMLLNFFKRIGEQEGLDNIPNSIWEWKHAFDPKQSDLFDQLFSANWQEIKPDLIKLKRILEKHTPITFTDKDWLLIFSTSLMTEALICLERSIYWFLNYRFNLLNKYRVAAQQSKYYSEFFGITGIGRYLGVANVHFPYPINIILVKRDWHENSISINLPKKRGSSHIDQFNLVKETLNQFSELPEILKDLETLLDKKRFFLKENREDTVYDLNMTIGVVFEQVWSTKDFYETTYLEYNNCFIRGEERVADELLIGLKEDFDPEVLYKSVNKDYADYGYEEHYIGTLLEFLILQLKELAKINPTSHSYLNLLRKKIETFDSGAPKARKYILEYFD